MESGDPFRLIDVLTKHEVPFVIIGGHAVTYHGYLRATEDTDVVFQRTAGSELALFAALSEVHAQWIGNEIDPATGLERAFPVSINYIQHSHLMMLVTDLGFLDIFDFIPGHPETNVDLLFATALENRGRRFSSLNWLRKMKLAAGRTKDQLDLENLPPDSE
jgi:hypothetical protein